MKKDMEVYTYSILINTERKKVALLHLEKENAYVFLSVMGKFAYNTLEAAYLSGQVQAKRVSEVVYSFNYPLTFSEDDVIDSLNGFTEELYILRDLGEATKYVNSKDAKEVVWLDIDEVEKYIDPTYAHLWEKGKPVVAEYLKDVVPGKITL